MQHEPGMLVKVDTHQRQISICHNSVFLGPNIRVSIRHNKQVFILWFLRMANQLASLAVQS